MQLVLANSGGAVNFYYKKYMFEEILYLSAEQAK